MYKTDKKLPLEQLNKLLKQMELPFRTSNVVNMSHFNETKLTIQRPYIACSHDESMFDKNTLLH